MVKEYPARGGCVCVCPECQHVPHGPVARDHRAIKQVLALADERMRRLLAGLLARQMGPGGIARLARITGLSRNTIAKGLRDLRQSKFGPLGRIRLPGGGRKRMDEKHPGFCGPCRICSRTRLPAIRSPV
jgi:hypothetical protein